MQQHNEHAGTIANQAAPPTRRARDQNYFTMDTAAAEFCEVNIIIFLTLWAV